MTSVYQFGPYSLALLASACVALMLIPILWQRRHAPGARYMVYLEAGVVVWSLTAAFESAALLLPTKIIWSKIGYLGITVTPTCYFLFAWDYSQRQNPLPRGIVAGLFLFSGVTTFLAFTNEWHRWIWSRITINEPYNLAVYEHGFWWWLLIVYAYTLSTLGIFLLLRALQRVPTFYAPQFIALAGSSLITLLGSISYAANLGPIAGMDLTPISFAVNGLLIVWGVYRFHVFDLTPIARTRLVESMQDGMLVLDARDRIVDLNPALTRLLQPSEPIVLGKTPAAVLPSGSALMAALAAGQTTVELLIDAPNMLCLDIQVTQLYGRTRHPIGRLLIFRDVSARKSAERALRELNSNLEADVLARTADIQAEKERADTILRSIEDAIAMTDVTLHVEFVNEAFCRLTGYAESEVVGQTITRLLQPRKEGESQLPAFVRHGTWQGEVRVRRQDGRGYDALMRAAPIFDSVRNLAGYVTSHRDISRQKAAERARARFIDSIVHEFRTPLTNLKLYNHLLSRQLTDEKAAHYLAVQAQQMERLEHLVQDSLDLFLLDNGQSSDEWGPVHAGALLQQVLDELAGKAQQAKLTLQAGPLAELPPLHGNGVRLAQALREVVENSLAYTPAGGRVLLGARLASRGPVPGVEIVVEDTGPGVSAEERPYLFERFFRGTASEAGRIPGTGLGLSIARTIVESHDGQIELTNRAEGGTRAALWFPASDARAASGKQQAKAKRHDKEQRA